MDWRINLKNIKNFINSSECDINVLCISETPPKKIHFNLNVNIEGYRQPFALGSKSSRGGVACEE